MHILCETHACNPALFVYVLWEHTCNTKHMVYVLWGDTAYNPVLIVIALFIGQKVIQYSRGMCWGRLIHITQDSVCLFYDGFMSVSQHTLCMCSLWDDDACNLDTYSACTLIGSWLLTKIRCVYYVGLTTQHSWFMPVEGLCLIPRIYGVMLYGGFMPTNQHIWCMYCEGGSYPLYITHSECTLKTVSQPSW